MKNYLFSRYTSNTIPEKLYNSFSRWNVLNCQLVKWNLCYFFIFKLKVNVLNTKAREILDCNFRDFRDLKKFAKRNTREIKYPFRKQNNKNF